MKIVVCVRKQSYLCIVEKINNAKRSDAQGADFRKVFSDLKSLGDCIKERWFKKTTRKAEKVEEFWISSRKKKTY